MVLEVSPATLECTGSQFSCWFSLVVVKDLTGNRKFSLEWDLTLTSSPAVICSQLKIHMNSGSPIEITNRFYTLSFWVSSLVEAGFQISQFHEPHVNPKDIPSDAPSFMRYYAEWPSAMFWVCTKVPVVYEGSVISGHTSQTCESWLIIRGFRDIRLCVWGLCWHLYRLRDCEFSLKDWKWIYCSIDSHPRWQVLTSLDALAPFAEKSH